MLNIVTLQGNLTRDPEIKYFEQDKVVAQCAIAHNTKVNGQDKTCFLEFSIWNKQAEALANHTRKGSQIILEGQLSQEFWNDQNTGQQRSKHVLKANRFHFCGSKQQPPATVAQQEVTVQPQVTPVAAPTAPAQQPTTAAPVTQPAAQVTAAAPTAPAQQPVSAV